MKKYEFTDETIKIGGHILHRIKALVDIPSVDIRAGDLGGFIEKKANLSQRGEAWVHDGARVWGDAKVFGNATINVDATVCGSARVYGDAVVFGGAEIFGATKIRNIKVWGAVLINDNEIYA